MCLRKHFKFFSILVLSLMALGITLSLGMWQWRKAELKRSLDANMVAMQQAPVWDMAEYLEALKHSLPKDQRVTLQGHWIPQWSVLLENRPLNGRAGFWVLTPFEMAPGAVVLVQRGWLARDATDRTKIAPYETPLDLQTLTGRVSEGPSKMFELPTPWGAKMQNPGQETMGHEKIRLNIDVAAFAKESGLPIVGCLVELGANSQGLDRDWPVLAVSAERNMGYAIQWFGLSVLIVLLYIWYQILQPLRHAKSS